VTRVQTPPTTVDAPLAGAHPDIVAIHRRRANSAGHTCRECLTFCGGTCATSEASLLLTDAEFLACPACGQNRRTTPGCHTEALGAERPVAA
jgi:hypothetical protein